MPRPVIHQEDRVAQTVRMSPELKEGLEDLARSKGLTLNDLVVEILGKETARSDADRTVRGIADAAVAMATVAMKRLEKSSSHTLDSEDARIVAAEAMLQVAISETVRRMVLPDAEMIQIGILWEMILVDAKKLGLKGPIWDYLRSLGPSSPPPTDEHREALSDEITKLKKGRASRERLNAVESLNIWLGLAVDQHDDTWKEIQARQEERRNLARAALVAALTSNDGSKTGRK